MIPELKRLRDRWREEAQRIESIAAKAKCPADRDVSFWTLEQHADELDAIIVLGRCGVSEPFMGNPLDAPTRPAGGSMTDLAEKIKGLLKVARCPDPNCDNKGCTIEHVKATEHACCGQFTETGECCGNSFPVPVEDIGPAPCQWCHERDAALAELSETNDEH